MNQFYLLQELQGSFNQQLMLNNPQVVIFFHERVRDVWELYNTDSFLGPILCLELSQAEKANATQTRWYA